VSEDDVIIHSIQCIDNPVL